MRKPNEEGVPNLELICDYLNANTLFSEAHRRLLKLMRVSLISGGRAIQDEDELKNMKKRIYVRRR